MKLNKKVEKIRDDLYVKKVTGGYKVVYPSKDHEGNPIHGNLKRLFIRDFLETLPTLLVALLLIGMLLPGALQIKEECEMAVNDCIDNACDICVENKVGPYNPNINITELEKNNVRLD